MFASKNLYTKDFSPIVLKRISLLHESPGSSSVTDISISFSTNKACSPPRATETKNPKMRLSLRNRSDKHDIESPRTDKIKHSIDIDFLPDKFIYECLGFILANAKNACRGFYLLEIPEESIQTLHKLLDSFQAGNHPLNISQKDIHTIQNFFKNKTFTIYKNKLVKNKTTKQQNGLKNLFNFLIRFTVLQGLKVADVAWIRSFLLSPEYVNFFIDSISIGNFNCLWGDHSLANFPFQTKHLEKVNASSEIAFSDLETKTIAWSLRYDSNSDRYRLLEFLFFAHTVYQLLQLSLNATLFWFEKQRKTESKRINGFQKTHTLENHYFDPRGLQASPSATDIGCTLLANNIDPKTYNEKISVAVSEGHFPLDTKQHSSICFTDYPSEPISRGRDSGRWLKISDPNILSDADIDKNNSYNRDIKPICKIDSSHGALLWILGFNTQQNHYYFDKNIIDLCNKNRFSQIPQYIKKRLEEKLEKLKLPEHFDLQSSFKAWQEPKICTQPLETTEINTGIERVRSSYQKLSDFFSSCEKELFIKTPIKNERNISDDLNSEVIKKIESLLRKSFAFFKEELDQASDTFLLLDEWDQYKGPAQALFFTCLSLFSLPHFEIEEIAEYINPFKATWLVLKGEFGAGKSTALKAFKQADALLCQIFKSNSQNYFRKTLRPLENCLKQASGLNPDQDIICWENSSDLTIEKLKIWHIILSCCPFVFSVISLIPNLINPYASSLIIANVFNEKFSLNIPENSVYYWQEISGETQFKKTLEIVDVALPSVLYLAALFLCLPRVIIEYYLCSFILSTFIPKFVKRLNCEGLLDVKPDFECLNLSPRGVRIENFNDLMKQDPNLIEELEKTYTSQLIHYKGSSLYMGTFNVWASENDTLENKSWQTKKEISNFISTNQHNLNSTLIILLFNALRKLSKEKIKIKKDALAYFCAYPKQLNIAVLNGFQKRPNDSICLQRELFDLTAKLIISHIHIKNSQCQNNNTITLFEMQHILQSNHYLIRNLILKAA